MPRSALSRWSDCIVLGVHHISQRTMRFSLAFFHICASLVLENASAWAPSFAPLKPYATSTPSTFSIFSRRDDTSKLYMSEAAASDSGLSDEEWKIVSELYGKASGDGAALAKIVLEALPTINPTLIMKLRGAVEDSREECVAVKNALNSVLDARLAGARDVLFEFLNAGEIRKLDALIGKAAREGKLDVAFFQVLNMNLQDASQEQPEEAESDENTANRFQILQHIYTRCQEEVEKTIPPGVALLNKLLRTDATSIRSNQLTHYLCPQSNLIKTPDGKELKLEGRDKILVSHQEFIEAIGNAVKQIRTVEKAGGANKEMVASMVESCRQVAKEARMVIAEKFGQDSEELKKFEAGLMPVFRPSSSESPYIQGQQ